MFEEGQHRVFPRKYAGKGTLCAPSDPCDPARRLSETRDQAPVPPWVLAPYARAISGAHSASLRRWGSLLWRS